MARVLVAFASGDEPESKKLKDLLQAKLGTSYNLNSIKSILAEDSTLEDELSNSSSVVLAASKQSCELIRNKASEKDCGGIVMFDGEVIHRHIEEQSLLNKMVVVQMGSSEHTIDGLDQKRVFLVADELNSESTVLDEMVDAIKGTVSSKVNEKPEKKGKKKNKCTQM